MPRAGERLRDWVEAGGLLRRDPGPWPAIVQSYDSETLQATVTPTPQISDHTTGAVYDVGPIEVPVLWLGGGSVVFQFELVEGDEVLLVPTGPSLRAWLGVGGVRPGTGPGKSLGESVAIPVRLSAGRRPGSSGGLARVGRDDGSATVIITMTGDGSVRVQAPTVVLGSEAAPKLAVARDGDDVTRSAAFETWQQAVSAGAMVAPLPPGPIGDVDASSTEVSSS